MPPKKAAYEDPPDMPIALRMRYGIHTFTLLVEPLSTFSDITGELVFAIRDRDPKQQGLLAHPGAEPVFLPPEGEEVHITYGVMRDPNDSAKGWKDLKIQGDETPVGKGLKNNTLVAFVIQDADSADGAAEFVTQWPQLNEPEDEEMEEDDHRPGASGKGKLVATDEDDDLDV